MAVKNAAGAKRKAPVGRSGPVGSPKKARLQEGRKAKVSDPDPASDSDMDDFSTDSEDGGAKLTPAPKPAREKEGRGNVSERRGAPQEKGMSRVVILIDLLSALIGPQLSLGEI